MDDNLKNLDKYETWQQKSDDLKEKLNETKENLDKFDTPTSEVGEREKQKRFLNVSVFLVTPKFYYICLMFNMV